MANSSVSSESIRVETLDAEGTEELGRRLGTLVVPGDVVLLDGPLGVGKTTLVRGMAAVLGFEGTVTSPSYTIVHEYPGAVGIAHIDLYRLERTGEIEDLGLDEILDGRHVVLVEWGAVAAGSFGPDRLEVEMSYGDATNESARVIVLRPVGDRWRGELAHEFGR